MSQRPPILDPIKALLQEQGLAQPSAPFSASLTRLLVARYVSPPAEPFRAGAWLGKAVLLGLVGLLLLVSYLVPLAISAALGASLVALVLGTGGLIWLLEQHRKWLLQQETGGSYEALAGSSARM